MYKRLKKYCERKYSLGTVEMLVFCSKKTGKKRCKVVLEVAFFAGNPVCKN